jgi:gamma-glutamylcyclotransferase (GGCT)/AIG2-like uncharacterized protein YtfP
MRVFVYGTLKVGFGNNYLLAAGTYVGKAVTEPKYTMYSAGHFPYVRIGGSQKIQGEVFEVNEVTVRQLDQLEQHPNWYKRQVVQTSLGEAWMYIMPPTQQMGGNEVKSGNWR